MNVDEIEKKITRKTKAIVPVHLYGQCCDMECILSIAQKHDLYVIEDTAQALGAIYTFSDGKTRPAGTMGTIGTTSFFPSKNLGCFGDGGAIFTNDPTLAEKIKIISNHGQRVKYHHELIGINSRLDTLQAAVLSVKLKKLNEYTGSRNAVAHAYDVSLEQFDFIETPFRASNSSHGFHQYTIKVVKERDRLKTLLEENGIPSMIYYPVPLHLQIAYRQDKFPRGSFPITEKLSDTVLSLPIHTELTDEEIQYIVGVISKF
jgi:dTDP-4-amino-4,6-dideoxygalactose transaminase